MEQTPRACTGNPIALSHFKESYRAEPKLGLRWAACWSAGSWAVLSTAPASFSCPVCPVPFAALWESTPVPAALPEGGRVAVWVPTAAVPCCPGRGGCAQHHCAGSAPASPLLELGLFTGDAEPDGRCKHRSPLLLLGFLLSQSWQRYDGLFHS